MLDLAASTLMFLSYVVLLQVARNSTMMTAGAYSIQDTCPASALEQVSISPTIVHYDFAKSCSVLLRVTILHYM